MRRTFLERWDGAIRYARLTGEPGRLWKLDRTADDMAIRLTARTMHPSFMALHVVKHDPERDR